MKKNFFNMIKIEHNGSQGVESVILAPLMLTTFFLLLYFFFMSLTFIAYNNIANSIAQELNMRQSGYQWAINDPKYKIPPQILTYKTHKPVSNHENSIIPSSGYVDLSAIKIYPATPALKSGAYFAINKYKNQFIIPFSEIIGIEVTSSKGINVSDGIRMSGALITVKIYYNSMIIGNSSHGIIPMTAIGYSVIS